ncbi:3-hydroxyisobutyryl-CoA hydrolase [Dipsacomyces acuminosporus]|nr:3-hydroxyisobutyryl-CoA hydrolase [Dipsacomyces acuminosporus]
MTKAMTAESALNRLEGLRRTLATSATSEGDKEVLTLSNLTGRSIVLNRPKALNALNHPMVKSIKKHLLEWRKSDLCDVVMLRSNSDKAFCAGGDVVSLSNTAKESGVDQALTFLQDEYQVNHLLASYEKPVVALINGYTMGGGVGLSVHAPFRVATESTVFAMPETKIGFFPDVGATFFLPRLDGETGTYLGLTGNRLKGRDLVYAGIATHYVPSERLPLLEKRLQELGTSDYDVVNQAIEEFVDQPEGSAKGIDYSLASVRDAIDRCFKFNNMELIVEALKQELQGEHAQWAQSTLDTLSQMSPSSLKITLEQLRNGRRMDIQAAFNLELHLAAKSFTSHDFHEGIDALLVRKSKDPKWQPATLEGVNMRELHAEYFEQEPKYAVDFINANAAFKEYPHKFGLPTERDIGALVRGENPQAGSFGMTRKDVIQFFERETGGKLGASQKVSWVLDRKTRELPDSFVLEWVK